MSIKRHAADALLALILAGLVGMAGRAAGLDPAGTVLAAGSLLTNPAPSVQAAGRVLREALTPEEQAAAEDSEDIPGRENPLRTEAPAPSPLPTPEPPPPPEEEPPPAPRPADALPVQEQHFGQGSGSGYVPLPAGTIKNVTDLSDGEVARMAGAGLPFSVERDSDEAQVLIMHTHTTESYLLNDGTWYAPEDTARTTVNEENVTAVGAEMARVLNEAGIRTLHDVTLHDYPSYVGSYERSHQTVQNLLKENPGVKVVLDVHRDAIERSGARIAPVAETAEGKAAQVMVICGCDNGGNLPDYPRNLAFAAAWESTMEGMFPGLTRPVLFDYRYYNQDLTTGSLLIEVGGHGNTLEEAVLSGRLVGQALVRLFGAG